ncbi:hypothetical protein OG21DRAFT_1520628 [Imleria badia]|nr:hypothetical protein OG21DRAFT_1520628 [Imleria badia]
MRVFSFIPALLLVTISFVAATLAAPTANAVLPNLNATLAGCGSDDNIQQVTNIVTSAINRIKVALAAPGTIIVPVFSCLSDNYADPSGDNSLWRIATSVRIQVQTALKDVREVTENNPKRRFGMKLLNYVKPSTLSWPRKKLSTYVMPPEKN